MKLVEWLVAKFRYYVVCSKEVFFILGPVFGYALVENAVFSILITHLTDEWNDSPNLPKAATIVNLQEGSSKVLQIFFTFVADAYSGLFLVLVISTAFYIIGFSLLAVAARGRGLASHLDIFYTALVILTVSKAAKKFTLRAFLGDQLCRGTSEEERERACTSGEFWWRFVSAVAAIIALLGLSQIDSFQVLSIVSACVMCASFSWFLLGTNSYRCTKPTGSPLTDVAVVVRTAISNRNAEYHLEVPPRVPWLRWLDRAAVVVGEHVCTSEQVKGVKTLLKMIPMWTTFLTFSVVLASGSTFFLEEINNIDTDSPVMLFTILQSLACFLVGWISDSVLRKLGKTRRKSSYSQRVMLVRIGIGMICCVVCCVVAWTNARHWLRLVRVYADKSRSYMSVYRLMPQYVLLGIIEGLSADGLEDFFDSQVSESVSRYGPAFGECVMGVGKFVSVVFIISFNKWFEVDINSSRLDKYYGLLAILSSVNVIIYWLVAYWYGEDRFLTEKEAEVETGGSGSGSGAEEDSYGLRSLFSRSISGPRILPLTEKDVSGDDGPPFLSGVRSFPRRPSSGGIYRRFFSMR